MTIELRGLEHHYDTQILHGLDLKLEGYKSVALIGSSGSGKSTLMRIMAGLENPTGGSVCINEQCVNHTEYRESVGFVFQNHNLFPHLTLLKNITLVLEKTRGQSKEEARENAYKYLKLLQLFDQKDKLPRNVSGGQAQRGSIARALSIDPEVIFLDEPTASLDPILTYEVLSAIKELRTLGKAFIFSSHVLSFVQDFAQYVVFLHQGRIVEHGPPSILKAPTTPELQEFMIRVP